MGEDRANVLRNAEDFFFKRDGQLMGVEKVVMFGGEGQVLLDCYGVWEVAKVSEVFLPSELTEAELTAYYKKL